MTAPVPRITLTCPVCGAEFQRRERYLARIKTPTCSSRCNGHYRGQEWAKHGWKGPIAKGYGPPVMHGNKNPAWKGGVTYRHRKGNYVQVRYVRAPEWAKPMARKDGYVMEHRLVMAKIVGRLLTRTECVHHLDHDPLNNEPANLELWPTNADHRRGEHGHFVEGVANRVSLAA